MKSFQTPEEVKVNLRNLEIDFLIQKVKAANISELE